MLLRYPVVAIAFALLLGTALRAEEDAKYDLHELSLWGLDPTLEQANELQHYPSAMPGVVDTDRSRANEARKLTPVSVITLYGEPVKDLEIDLRVQSGRFVGHWPPAESKSGRLRWLELASTADPGKEALLATVDEKHWFVQARQLETMYIREKSRAERFLSYDCELKYELPVQISGGPDTYQVTNSGKHPLLDLFIIVPRDDGVRVGRLESLAPSKPKAGAATGNKAAGANTPAAPAQGKAPVATTPAKTAPEGEAKPEQNPPAEKKDEIKEEKTEAKPAVASPAAAAVPAAGAAPVAVAPGGAVPAAPAQAAPPKAANPAVMLEPTEIAMPPAVARDSDEFKAIGETITANLLKLGFTQQEIDLLLARAGNTWLEGKEMMVLFRLPVEAIEERLPLVAYPAPRKTLRTALVAVRNLDPKIKDEVQKLIAQLGSPEYRQREEAEKRLTELGRLAVPSLKVALKSKDLEIVFRSERILLAQNEKLDGT